MQTLTDMLGDSEIFGDREVLSPHYIPKKLKYREKEINSIERAIAPALKGERGRNLFIYGKTGTGKTSCAQYVLKEVNEIPSGKAKISYVNCRVYNSRYRVLSKVIADHLPTYSRRGYGAVDLYERIASWVEEDNKILVIVLDEIDIVRDLDDLIYTLTRLNADIRAGGVTIMGVSNRVSFKEELDPRSLSALYENELVFPPYNADELYMIIKDRVAKGFKENVISDDLLHIIASKAYREGGDARFSLKILTKAGELAEERGLKKITTKEAEDAIRLSENDIVYDVIATLPEHQKLVLYAIAQLTQSGGAYKKLVDGVDTYIFSGEIYNRYKGISAGLHKSPKSERWYRKYLSELVMHGIIDSFDSSKGIRGHTKLIKLRYPPGKTKEALDKELFGLSGTGPETAPDPEEGVEENNA